jgi:glutathione synthase/RimK-type ligase-like ATP-grasp enzyme
LRDLGAGVDLSVSITVNGKPEVEFSTAEGRFRLSDIGTIWWRRPGLPDAAPTGSTEEIASFVRDEWQHLIGSIEVAPLTRWVNLPSAVRLANHKSLQLAAAGSVGLRIPRTLITNDAAAVRPLLEQGADLVYKHLGGAPRPLTATRPLRADDVGRLNVLHNCPAIFQEYIDARVDVRVTALGADLYGAEIHSQMGDSPLDWRFDHSVPFKRHELDATVSRQLRRVMRTLNLEYAAIDLRLTPEGEYVFLEVNPAGQYLFVELLANIPLSEHMADFLLAHIL